MTSQLSDSGKPGHARVYSSPNRPPEGGRLARLRSGLHKLVRSAVLTRRSEHFRPGVQDLGASSSGPVILCQSCRMFEVGRGVGQIATCRDRAGSRGERIDERLCIARGLGIPDCDRRKLERARVLAPSQCDLGLGIDGRDRDE